MKVARMVVLPLSIIGCLYTTSLACEIFASPNKSLLRLNSCFSQCRRFAGRDHFQLDWLVGLGTAIIVVLGAPPVDDGPAADRDAIGLGAQRFTRDGRQFGPDAGAPA
jgi:hypothetical protein